MTRRQRKRQHIRMIRELRTIIKHQKKHGFNRLPLLLQSGEQESVMVAGRFISRYTENVYLIEHPYFKETLMF